MKKFVLYILLSFIFSFLTDATAQEKKKPKAIETISETPPSVILTIIDNNTIRIQNADKDTVLEIYDVLGVKVSSIKIDSIDQTIPLNLAKGCYILKIKEIARKIAIK